MDGESESMEDNPTSSAVTPDQGQVLLYKRLHRTSVMIENIIVLRFLDRQDINNELYVLHM